MYVCMFYLLWYPGNVPRRRFVPDSSPSEFGRRQQEDPSELAHHGCRETVGQTGERTVGKVGVRDRVKETGRVRDASDVCEAGENADVRQGAYLNLQNSSWAGSRVRCFLDQVFPRLFPIQTS